MPTDNITGFIALDAEFFAPVSDVVRIKEEASSSATNWIYDNKLTFLSGYMYDKKELNATLHEVAHMIEIDDKRCHIPNWGFKFGKKVRVGYQTFTEAETAQSILRECRVLGIQKHIAEHFDHNPDIKQFAISLRHLDAWCFVPGKTEKKRVQHCLSLAEVEYHKWSFETIKAEWFRKIAIVKKRQKRGCWKNYNTDDRHR